MSHKLNTGVEPTVMVIFGATGDLAKKKLFPVFFDLFSKKLLSPKFAILAFGRKDFDEVSYRSFVRDLIIDKRNSASGQDVDEFVKSVKYVRGNFDDFDSYKKLGEELNSADRRFNVCSNKLFYLAVPPLLYENILRRLHKTGLTVPCGPGGGWTRVLIEKPFGNDIDTAQKLDNLLGKLFDESQVFRIDHYLAKETIQNILVFRFSNALFEPIWNRKHIERIEIRMSESVTAEGRGAFYDKIGALRDVGQNHLLAMLSLITMDYPENYSAESIRRERAKVLRRLSLVTSSSVKKIIKGQYEGYINEDNVSKSSDTETFFSLTAYINNSRWKGVPIELSSGKAMSETATYIKVHFKDIDCGSGDVLCNRNTLTFRIQPDEGISIMFWVKKPGLGNESHPQTLTFNYSDSGSPDSIPDAYERVLYDCIRGDQTLFASTKETEYAWKFVCEILNKWGKNSIRIYKQGSSFAEIISNATRK